MVFRRVSNRISDATGAALIELSFTLGLLAFIVTAFTDVSLFLQEKGTVFEAARALGRDVSKQSRLVPNLRTEDICVRGALYLAFMVDNPREYEISMKPRIFNSFTQIGEVAVLDIKIERRQYAGLSNLFRNGETQFARSSFYLESGRTIKLDDGVTDFTEGEYICQGSIWGDV